MDEDLGLSMTLAKREVLVRVFHKDLRGGDIEAESSRTRKSQPGRAEGEKWSTLDGATFAVLGTEMTGASSR